MNAAYQLVKQAGISVTARELELLANDLQELAREDGLSLSQASIALLRRIGGHRKLRSYLDVLARGSLKPCPHCKGKGEVWRRAYGDGEWLEPCTECNGTGTTT